MDNESQLAFWARRRREELLRAQTERDTGLKILHRKWADLYRQRLVDSRRGITPPP